MKSKMQIMVAEGNMPVKLWQNIDNEKNKRQANQAAIPALVSLQCRQPQRGWC